MKGKEAHLTEFEHEEKNVGTKCSTCKTLENSGNDRKFSSSSNVPFKVEVKLEITMFGGQNNDEALDS